MTSASLHEIGYWIGVYRKAGDPAWELVLGWNLAIAGLAARAANDGARRADVT